MPATLSRTLLFTLGTALAAPAWASGDAAPSSRPASREGEVATCAAGVRITVGPPTLDPARARQILEQIASELGPHRGEHCGESATRIDVDLGDDDRARIAVEAQDGDARRRNERELDLAAIAEDGRPLAIAIAVDEVAREVHEQLAIRPAPPRAAPPPPPKRSREATPAPAPASPPAGAFGGALAVDAFTSGVTLIGPDARGALFAGPHLALGARAGVRAPVAWSSGPPEAWAFGASFALAPDVRAPSGFAGVVALDGLAVRSGVGKELAAALAASAGGSAWLALGGPFRLTLDVRVGGPIVPLRAHREDGAVAQSTTGALVTGALGCATSF